MPRRTGRSVWIVTTLVVTIGLSLVLMSPKEDEVEWISVPPANDPPRFGFLGRKWGWKANAFLQRLTRAKPKTVALTARVIELESLSSLTNFAPARLQATNQAGDRIWTFMEEANPAEKFRIWPGMREVSTSGVTWNEGNQAQLSAQNAFPLGFTNRTVTVGWWLDLWVHRVDLNSLRLTFFTTASEIDKTRMHWVSNTVTEIGVQTNAWFGAHVTVPMGGSVFVLSSRTNLDGKYIGALLSPTLP